MKLKMNKVDVRKQRRKALIYFAAAVFAFTGICLLGLMPISTVLFCTRLLCLYQGVIALAALGIGLVQERREKAKCEEKEPSSAQS